MSQNYGYLDAEQINTVQFDSFGYGLEQHVQQNINDHMNRVSGNKEQKRWKLPNFAKRALGILYRYLPKYLTGKDAEDGSDSARIESKLKKWWMFSGAAFTKAVAAAFLVYVAVCVIYYTARSEPVGSVFKNRRGVPMNNVKLSFTQYDNPKEWILTRTIKEVRSSNLSPDEMDSGYFRAFIRDTGDKNVSIQILEESLKESCPVGKCLCISATHLGVAKNLVYLRGMEANETGDVFMINPDIAEKSDKLVRVSYQNKKSTHQDLHNQENWVKRPEYITVIYNKLDGKIARKLLDTKGSACVYECVNILNS